MAEYPEWDKAQRRAGGVDEQGAVEYEVIPPRRANAMLTDVALERLATLLDDAIPIPGTGFRIGWDAIAGLIPGIGDLATAFLSLVFVFAGWSRGLPKVAILRMLLNIAIDTVVGTVPLAGDFFDAAWKSNRMNFELLMRYKNARSRRRESFKDALFLLGVGVLVFVILAAPVVALWALVHWIARAV